MSIIILIMYFLFSILLFIIDYNLDYKLRLSKINRLVISIIYMIIFCSIFSKFNNFKENIYLIYIFELIINLFYYNHYLHKDFFNNKDYLYIYYIILIILGYFINITFLKKIDNILLSKDQLKLFIWLIIFFYIIKFIDNLKYNNKKIDIEYEYNYLNNLYGEYINSDKEDINRIIYSIMIYQNYNNNIIERSINKIKFKSDNKKHKYGIMQVESKVKLNDIESIELILKKISLEYNKKKINKDNDIKEIIKKFYEEEYNEIINIYKYLKKNNIIEE